jgi:hypothetical protein
MQLNQPAAVPGAAATQLVGISLTSGPSLPPDFPSEKGMETALPVEREAGASRKHISIRYVST